MTRSPLSIVVMAVCCTLAMTAAPASGQKRAVGYYPSWTQGAYPAPKVRYASLTQIAHAFVWPNADGTLHVPSGFVYPALIQQAHVNDVRVIVAVGGWGQSDGFAPMAADPVKRGRFVDALVDFVVMHGYDGIDLDWEYPYTGDSANLVRLAEELRTALDAVNPAYTLSAAVPATDWPGGYDVGSLVELMDWFGVMTYDYHGSWTDHSGHNSPLYPSGGDLCGSVNESVAYWLNRGVPKAKLHIGMAFYGRDFNTSGLYAPSTVTGDGSSTYAQIAARLAAGWEVYHRDDVAKVPYLQNASQTTLTAYDDPESIRLKSAYVLDQDLGGAIIWALGQDYTANGEQPLLTTVGAHLREMEPIAAEPAPEIPDRLDLGAAYPNPFVSRTTIPFLTDGARINVTVFDMLGRRVAVLADGAYPAGTYEVTWEAADVPAGPYLVTLDSGARHSRTLVVRR